MNISEDDDNKKVEEIQEEFEHLNDLLDWNRKFLIFGGIWPLENTKFRAAIFTAYMTFHLFTEYSGVVEVVGNFEAMVLGIIESSMQSMVLSKLFVFRHSKNLRVLISAMKEDFQENNYNDLNEKKIYLKYNYYSKLYFKLSVPYVLTIAALYYARPLLTSLILGTFGVNDSLILPFQTKLFFPIDNTQTYFYVYIWYCPMVYLLACHNAFICILITIILHICGQLAVVEYRIKNLKYDHEKDHNQMIFKTLVQRHQRSIWMAKTFDTSFNVVLLIDLIGSTVLIGLLSYSIVTESETLETSFVYIYICAIIATLFLLFGYCYVGECLVENSTRVHEVYYECEWHKMSLKFQKSLSFCLMETEKPLTMTAGKIFVFSLSGYAYVIKSAMGYVSMLRNVSM
uniref:Odorant receptor n=1 Tax=Aphidius gifuensis TaxID=684658 RepID=A0A3S9LWA7_APHGI|nr:odorant receptor [Aphidius gifuensis]